MILLWFIPVRLLLKRLLIVTAIPFFCQYFLLHSNDPARINLNFNFAIGIVIILLIARVTKRIRKL